MSQKNRRGWERLAIHLGMKREDVEKMSIKTLFNELSKRKAPGKTIADMVADLDKVTTTAPAKVEKIEDAKVEIVKDVPAPVPQNHRVDVAAPQITMNVPAPVVNVGTREAPQWWDIVAAAKDAVLYIAFGAFMWSLVGQKFVTVAALVR